MSTPEHPGDVLRRDYMEAAELSAYALAQQLDVARPTVNELLRGRKRVTVQIAIKLGRRFDTDPRFWLHLQTEHDLHAAGAARRQSAMTDTDPELPNHYRDRAEPRRFAILQRLDGLGIACELQSGRPVFLATLPTGGPHGVDRSVVLEGACSVADAVGQAEERWPPSPWVEGTDGSPDYGPGAGSVIAIPFEMGGEPVVILDNEHGAERAPFPVSLSTPRITFAGFSVVGARVRFTGKGHAVLESVQQLGDINLLYRGLSVAGDGREGEDGEPLPSVRDVFDLRRTPQLHPNNHADCSLRCEVEAGEVARLAVELLVRRVADPAAGRPRPGGMPGPR